MDGNTISFLTTTTLDKRARCGTLQLSFTNHLVDCPNWIMYFNWLPFCFLRRSGFTDLSFSIASFSQLLERRYVGMLLGLAADVYVLL
jgi:hypothetical protein